MRSYVTGLRMHIPLKSGAIIPILIMLPNLAWMLLAKGAMAGPRHEPRLLAMAEYASRVVVLVLPFFSTLDPKRKAATPVMVGMAVALGLYYAGWLRYFLGGRAEDLLNRSMLGVPLPMALFPVIFLVLSSYLMGSWWMLVASLSFGIAHIVASALT